MSQKRKNQVNFPPLEIGSLFAHLQGTIILVSLAVFPFIFDAFTVSKLLVAAFGLLIFSVRFYPLRHKAEINNIPSWLICLIGVYAVVILVAWLVSDVPFIRGAFGQFGRGNGLLYYFFTILIFIFSIKTMSVAGSAKAYHLVQYFSWFLAVYASLQKIGIDVAKLDTRGISPVVLTFGNSNFAGGMISVLFTFHLIHAIKSKVFKIHTVLLLISLLVSATFAAAVQGYLIIAFAIVFGISIYLLQRNKSRWLPKAIFAGWFLGLLAVALGVTGKFVLASIFSRTSFQARIEYWRISIGIIKDYPLFGVGPDKIFDASAYYMSPGSLKLITTTRMDNAHNWYLNLAANYGIISLLLLLLILTSVFVFGIKLISQRNSSDSFAIASFSAFSAMFIDGLVSIEQPGIGVWLYFFGGATIGSYLNFKKQVKPGAGAQPAESLPLHRDFRGILVIVSITALAFSVTATSTRVVQDALLRKSIQTQLLGKGNQSTLESIEVTAMRLRAEPEYAVQALQSLAAAGDRNRVNSVSKSTYHYYRASIQATLIRADILRVLGRSKESCPLRITLINNTPWDMNQLEPYLTCLLKGLNDKNYQETLERVSQYLPANEESVIQENVEELSLLILRFQKYTLASRVNYLIGNRGKAVEEREYALKLMSRILVLEQNTGSSPAQPMRNDYLELLKF